MSKTESADSRKPFDDSGKSSDDYLTIPESFRSMQYVTGCPASAFFLGNAKLHESNEVTIGGVARNGEHVITITRLYRNAVTPELGNAEKIKIAGRVTSCRAARILSL